MELRISVSIISQFHTSYIRPHGARSMYGIRTLRLWVLGLKHVPHLTRKLIKQQPPALIPLSHRSKSPLSPLYRILHPSIISADSQSKPSQTFVFPFRAGDVVTSLLSSYTNPPSVNGVVWALFWHHRTVRFTRYSAKYLVLNHGMRASSPVDTRTTSMRRL